MANVSTILHLANNQYLPFKIIECEINTFIFLNISFIDQETKHYDLYFLYDNMPVTIFMFLQDHTKMKLI